MKAVQVLRLPTSDVSLHREIERLRCQLQVVQSTLDAMNRRQLQLDKSTISVYTSGTYRQVDVNEISMIRAMNNYSTIYLDNGDQLFTSRTLKYWEGQCSSIDMVRIHSSFLIHKNKINSIQTDTSTIQLKNGLSAHYSRMSKDMLLRLLGAEKYVKDKNIASPKVNRLNLIKAL